MGKESEVRGVGAYHVDSMFGQCTPDMVADLFQEWMEKTNCNGFNLVYASNPGDYKDIVEMLVPVLQKRGLIWDDYTVLGGTYRENLHNTPGNPYLNPRHAGSMFRRNAPKTEPIVDTESAFKNEEVVSAQEVAMSA